MKKMQLLSFHQHHVRHGGPDAPPEDKRLVETEIQLLKKLDHGNIMRLSECPDILDMVDYDDYG